MSRGLGRIERAILEHLQRKSLNRWELTYAVFNLESPDYFNPEIFKRRYWDDDCLMPKYDSVRRAIKSLERKKLIEENYKEKKLDKWWRVVASGLNNSNKHQLIRLKKRVRTPILSR